MKNQYQNKRLVGASQRVLARLLSSSVARSIKTFAWVVFCLFIISILASPFATPAVALGNTDQILNAARSGAELDEATQKGILISEAIPSLSRTQRAEYEIEIVETSPIEGGVVALARAWQNGEQLGFGSDGSVDIERFRIFNPPLYVSDPLGEYVRNEFDDVSGETATLRYREDIKEALLQSIEQIISVKKEKFIGSKIEPGKIGKTTSTFYTNGGDGQVSASGNTNWDTIHDATNGLIAITTTPGRVSVFKNPSAQFEIRRALFPIDTSAIPDTDIITSATFSIYINALTDNGDNDGNDFFALVGPTTQNSVTTIITQDFDQVGAVNNPTELSNRVDYSALTLNTYNSWTLNEDGISIIDKTGHTKLGMREGHDILDIPYNGPNNTSNQIRFSVSAQSGTTQDPKLVVEHSAPPSGISISGTTDADNGVTVRAAVNGVIDGSTTTTSGGAWTLSNVSVNSGETVVVWFDGVADNAESTAVAKYSGTGDMSGLVLNTNTLTLGSDDDQSFSLSDLALYDCDDDEDIMYSSNSSTLLLEGCSNSYTAEVFSVGSGEAFSNTGTVTITSTAAGALSGSGSFTNGTSATLNYAGSTLTVTTFGSTAAGNTVNYISSSSNQTVRSGTYQNLGIGTVSDSDTGRTFTLSGETIVSGTLTVGNAGSTNSDVLDTSSSGNYTLIFSSANITARGTLNGNGSIIAIIGTGTPLSVTGTFNAGTSTVQFSGGSNTNINSLSYNNLSLLPLSGSATYTLDAGTFSVNNLTLGGGPVGVTIDADTNDPSINIRGDLVINSNATYTKGGGAIAFRKGDVQTWTDNTAGIQDLGIVQIYANDTNTTLSLGSNARATSLLIDTNQEFSAGSYTFTITGSGTPLNNSGTFTPGTSTVVYNANQATNIASVSYNNLTLAPASSGGPTYTLPSGTFDVVDLVLGDGTNAVTVTAATNNPNIEIAGDFTINANAVFTKGSGGILFDKVGEQTLTDNTTAKQDLGDVEVGETSGVQSEISRVQYKSSSNTGVSTLSATLDSNATAGNLLVVLVSSGSDSLASASVTDTLGNTYQLAGGVTSATAENVSSTAEHLIFYAENIAGGANTVTINFGGEMTSVVMTVVEYSGIAEEESFDQISSSRYSSANHSGTPSSTYDSGVVTINSYRELLIGISTTLQTADIYTPAAGWTEVTSSGPASGVSHVVQEYFIEEFGTHKASGTLSSAQNIHSASIATFRVAVASITKLNLATDIKLASLTVDENHMVDLNGSNTLVLTGNGTPLSVSGVFKANTGTIEFASSGTTGTAVPSHISYYNLKLNKVSNSFTMPAGNVTVKNNLEVSAGTLDLNTNDPAVTVQGDLIIDGSLSASSSSSLVVNGDLVKNGTFTHNNGTVAIIPNSTSTVQGGASFYNLIVSGPGKTLQFEAGDTIIVSNVLDLQGKVGSPLTITSDTGSSAWTINYQGSNPTLKHIIVRYAACHASSLNMSPGTREQVSNGGNNGSCWVFLIFGGNSSSVGGGSGGGTPQTGGGQDGGSDSGTESGSGGGEGQTGGGSGGGGNASP